MQRSDEQGGSGGVTLAPIRQRCNLKGTTHQPEHLRRTRPWRPIYLLPIQHTHPCADIEKGGRERASDIHHR